MGRIIHICIFLAPAPVSQFLHHSVTLSDFHSVDVSGGQSLTQMELLWTMGCWVYFSKWHLPSFAILFAIGGMLDVVIENIAEFSDKWPSFCFPLCPLPMGDDRYFYILSSDVVDAGFFFRCRRCGIPGWSFPVVSKSPPLPGSHITIDRIISTALRAVLKL